MNRLQRLLALYQPYSDRDFIYSPDTQEAMSGPYMMPQESLWKATPDKRDLQTTSPWAPSKRFRYQPDSQQDPQRQERMVRLIDDDLDAPGDDEFINQYLPDSFMHTSKRRQGGHT